MVPSLRETTVNLKVAVVGGGPGEVSVAIAVARSGARSVLLERTAIFGGAAASGLGIHGLLDRSGTIALGALAQEFLERLSTVGGSPGQGKLKKPVSMRVCSSTPSATDADRYPGPDE